MMLDNSFSACACVKTVTSFAELVAFPFAGSVNAVCWQRSLAGNFAEVVERLAPAESIESVDEAGLQTLDLSSAGRAAVEHLLTDLELLRSHGLAPSLDCIRHYPRDESDEIVPTDVYSFHADSAPVATDTYLCSYTESSSEGVRNKDAVKCVDMPEIRARLLEEFGGADDADFTAYIQENCYDLHYRAKPGARPFAFGLGNLWRIAVQYPDSPVLPCVHRAPATMAGRPPRLLLIS